jgi:hypothetical protein
VNTTRFQRNATGLALVTALALGGAMSALPAGASRQATIEPSPVTVATTTTLRTSKPTTTESQSGRLTATVSSSRISLSSPTGTVDFMVNGSRWATKTLKAGKATFRLGTVTAGTYVITAKYSGSATFGHSTSGTITQVVEPPDIHA